MSAISDLIRFKKINTAYLSWKNIKKISETLNANRLLNYYTTPTIFFQEASEQDLELANQKNIQAIPCDQNIGTTFAFSELVSFAISENLEYFIYLENDWQLCENPNKAIKYLNVCLDLIDSGKADIVHLRNSKNPGSPLYCSGDRDIIDPNSRRKLEARFFRNPSDTYPEFVNSEIIDNNIWFFTTSKHQNWSAAPILCKTEFLVSNVLPMMKETKQDLDKHTGLEDMMIGYHPWHKHEYKIAASNNGLFTHCGGKKSKHEIQ